MDNQEIIGRIRENFREAERKNRKLEARLKILNKEKGAKTVNAQKWFNKNCPLNEKDKPSRIEICSGLEIVLEGSLEIKNFPNLEKLDFETNLIASVNVIDCPNINYLDFSNNMLTNLDFLTNLNPTKIIHLNISENNFPRQDLTIFSKFINLEYLNISNSLEIINNHFFGSLESLKNCKKIKTLIISSTKIDEGLEYLPEKLEHLSCRWTKLEESFKYSFNYDYQDWRKENEELILKVNPEELWKKLEKQRQEIQNLQLQITNQNQQKDIQNQLEKANIEKGNNAIGNQFGNNANLSTTIIYNFEKIENKKESIREIESLIIAKQNEIENPFLEKEKIEELEKEIIDLQRKLTEKEKEIIDLRIEIKEKELGEIIEELVIASEKTKRRELAWKIAEKQDEISNLKRDLQNIQELIKQEKKQNKGKQVMLTEYLENKELQEKLQARQEIPPK